MYLIYLDDSGNSGTNYHDPQQPLHFLLALIVPENVWRAVETHFQGLLEQFDVPVIDGRRLEIHAIDVVNGKRGWGSVGFQTKMALLEAILDIPRTFGLTIVYGGVRKKELVRQYGAKAAHPHGLCFLFAAERCQQFLSQPHVDGLGMLIHDASKGRETAIRRSLEQYRSAGVPFGLATEPLDRLIDTVHFVDSRESSLIQVADVIAYYTNRAWRKSKGVAIPASDLQYGRFHPQVFNLRVWPYQKS